MGKIGISYPFRIDRNTGRVILTSNTNHIRDAVKRIIEYGRYDLVGEAIGSGIREQVFDVSPQPLSNLISVNITRSLTNYVPDIDKIKVYATRIEDGKIKIVIRFRIIETGMSETVETVV